MDEPWMIDELAYAGSEHLDPGFVAGFDRKQGTDPADAIAALRRHGLTCVRAGFLSYQHAGPPADFVYTRNALHQLPDFWKAIALDRIAAMLRPGGVLRAEDLIYDFQPSDAADVFADWFDGAAGDPALGYTREDFIEHIRTEYSTFRWLFEPLLGAAGFEIAEVSYRASAYGSYVCVKR